MDIKNMYREQDDHLFLDTPMMVHDHNHHQHHQTHTMIFPFQESTVAKNQSSSSKGTQVIASASPKTKTNDATKNEFEGDDDDLGEMKETTFKIATMQPLNNIDEARIRKPRRHVRISDDPQSVAARHRRERISEKMRILQCIVPGGTKMDTVSMLDEAICYVKFLKRQICHLQANHPPQTPTGTGSLF